MKDVYKSLISLLFFICLTVILIYSVNIEHSFSMVSSSYDQTLIDGVSSIFFLPLLMILLFCEGWYSKKLSDELK